MPVGETSVEGIGREQVWAGGAGMNQPCCCPDRGRQPYRELWSQACSSEESHRWKQPGLIFPSGLPLAMNHPQKSMTLTWELSTTVMKLTAGGRELIRHSSPAGQWVLPWRDIWAALQLRDLPAPPLPSQPHLTAYYHPQKSTGTMHVVLKHLLFTARRWVQTACHQ